LPLVDVAPVDELPPGSVKIVRAGSIAVGVYNLDGEYYAIEDRCSHDDGPLAEGDFDAEDAVVVCPRHGSRFDIRDGAAKTPPAMRPVAIYPVRVQAGAVEVQLPT
jgi:3-phenylpropionate/trans-cinnamate dioxygenase ferredoxin component